MYKNPFVNVVETGIYVNLLVLSAFSFVYQIKADITMQTAVAYISTIITLILLIIYHVSMLIIIRKAKLPEEEEHCLVLDPVQPVRAIVTHTSVEIPNCHDQSPPPESNRNEAETIF